MNFKKEIADMLSGVIHDFKTDELEKMIEIPPERELGDFAFPCFRLAKTWRMPPAKIAETIMEKITEKPGFIDKIKTLSGYINVYLSRSYFAGSVIRKVLDEGDLYGAASLGKGKTVVFDYSAPNIAKPFHVGHLRSTAIGNSLYRIYMYMGYKCVGVNHIGDWGTQFGKMITAYKKWGDRAGVEAEGIDELNRLYVKFHEEAEREPSLNDEAREWFSKIEKGDPEAAKLWQWIKEISLEYFKKIYGLMDIVFDSWNGESFYNDKMDEVVTLLKEKKLLKESEGAMIVDLSEYNMPPCMILKSDGSSLYATRDIAAAIYRMRSYNFDKCIYVTAASQSLHFKQWFKVMELLGFDMADKLVHVPFGLVSVEGEKLATRKGNTVLLEDLIKHSIDKISDIMKEKNPDTQDAEKAREIAISAGVGAVIFEDLYSNRIKDINFSWQNALNFDGETGPYVQYAHARACSVLAKANNADLSDFDGSVLCTDDEMSLIKSIYDLPSVIQSAMSENEPSNITRQLVEIAQSFNRFYHSHPILSDDGKLTKARLALVYAAKIAMRNSLWLIGLKAPERV